MQAVRSRNTGPELAVRRFLHRAGYRFRLHMRSLPGSPDLVLNRYRTVMFVHGCFWHRHPGCRRTTTPKTRHSFWEAKFEANVKRDAAAVEALVTLGWRVVVVLGLSDGNRCRPRSSAQASAWTSIEPVGVTSRYEQPKIEPIRIASHQKKRRVPKPATAFAGNTHYSPSSHHGSKELHVSLGSSFRTDPDRQEPPGRL